MKKELSDAIHRFNLINKSKSQLADWNLIRKALSGSGQNSAEKPQPSGETNTTKDKIIQILGNMSAEDRDEIFGNWCRLCGAELPCYCAPCYDE